MLNIKRKTIMECDELLTPLSMDVESKLLGGFGIITSPSNTSGNGTINGSNCSNTICESSINWYYCTNTQCNRSFNACVNGNTHCDSSINFSPTPIPNTGTSNINLLSIL